jgi:GNAT superfamily N-acetyltransferase
MTLTRIEFARDGAEWDRLCADFDDFTPTQSYAWGEGRRADGWQVRRDQWLDGAGRVVALAVVLARRRWGVRVVYLSRGPLVLRRGLSPPEVETNWKACLSAYSASLRVGEVLFCYVYQSSAEITPPVLRETGLHPAFPPAGEYSFSSLVTLSGPDALLSGASSDWRKIFRRSEAVFDHVESSSDPADFLRARSLVETLERRKGFATTLTSPLVRSPAAAGARLFYLENSAGKMVAALGVTLAGRRAARILAGVDAAEARQHPGLGRVLEVAAARWAFHQGAAFYDLEGLNPYNRGVYNFKIGMRGALFSPVGMHVCSRPVFLGRLYALWKQRRWELPLHIWQTSKRNFLQVLLRRLTGGRLECFRLRIYTRDLEADGPGRPGFTLVCLDRLDPAEFSYRLATVRQIWDPCRDLHPDRKECWVLLGERGYAAGYGFVYWGRAGLPEIGMDFPLGPQEIYIADCYLTPEYRGQRLYAPLLEQICAQARRRGARRAWIAADAANRPSVRGIETAGFVLEREAVWKRIGGWSRLLWRGAASKPSPACMTAG